jgi:predicted TIM-barrel fold metal-dependent hydrolase
MPQSRIDIFTHILPPKFREALYHKAGATHFMSTENDLEAHHDHLPAVFDLERRFKIMDKFEGLRQVLTLVAPPVEAVVGPAEAADLARLGNDEIAEVVAKYPQRFAAGVAGLPMNNIDTALKETERAVKELELRGVQIYTPCDGKPLDSPEFFPLYEMMERFDLPIWVHPIRAQDSPDYPGETYSKYDVFRKFGWPYETTIAMTRLVFSGVLDRYPKLKLITHHCGGFFPYLAQRLLKHGQKLDIKTDAILSRPAAEYFQMFYADTALTGNTSGLMCGYDFFGAGHLLFGTDMPYGGANRIENEIRAVEGMTIPDADKRQIFKGNARRILHI